MSYGEQLDLNSCQHLERLAKSVCLIESISIEISRKYTKMYNNSNLESPHYFEISPLTIKEIIPSTDFSQHHGWEV